jgi:hypothetical protein
MSTSTNYEGDLVARNSGGLQLVGRPQARPAWYPTDRVRPVRVEVWWRYDGEVAAAARLIGIYRPGQQVKVPLTPLVDRDLIFSVVTISSDGLRSVRELFDAHEVPLVYTRETRAPSLMQIGTATNTEIRIAIEGYSSLVSKRRITVADAAGNTQQQFETTIDPADVMDRVVYLRRAAQAEARPIFVTVAHSAGGAYGPDSSPLACTFATGDGSGGTAGTGQSFGHRDYVLT